MVYEIRRALPADADGLALLNEAFNEVTVPTAHIRECLERNPQEIVIVAICDGALVGFCCGQLYSSFCYGKPQAELTEMYVLTKHRRRGVGREMVLLLHEFFREKGAAAAHLLTNLGNSGAQCLYKSCGYVPTQDDLLMEARL